MDTFFVVLISGMAAGYVVELIVAISERWLSAKITRALFTAPLSILGGWALGLHSLVLLVSGLAAAFFALVIIGLINRPQVVQAPLTRRL